MPDTGTVLRKMMESKTVVGAEWIKKKSGCIEDTLRAGRGKYGGARVGALQGL